MADSYLTLETRSEAVFREKMSRFISFAIPVTTAADAKTEISRISNRYHDARHVCWAYMVGAERKEFLSSDNGEPSGTACKPILGQINSYNLTDIVIVVVRYFGGIKLGTSGLIAAYREAARQAIEAGTIVEKHVRASFTFTFPYMVMNEVMKIAKMPQANVKNQEFDNTCRMTIEANADDAPMLINRISAIDGVSIL